MTFVLSRGCFKSSLCELFQWLVRVTLKDWKSYLNEKTSWIKLIAWLFFYINKANYLKRKKQWSIYFSFKMFKTKSHTSFPSTNIKTKRYTSLLPTKQQPKGVYRYSQITSSTVPRSWAQSKWNCLAFPCIWTIDYGLWGALSAIDAPSR